MTQLPSGRFTGRRPDAPDARDLRYSAVHSTMSAAAASYPSSVDLESRLPPCYDQGAESSCGANSAAALACFLWPDKAAMSFSRQLLYYLIRHNLEETADFDAGVETRDVLKAMNQWGMVPEPDWPYDTAHFAMTPTDAVMFEALQHRIVSYSRLVQDTSYVNCLASGFPFILGFEVFESIDSDVLARTGVMTTPSPAEKVIGGHDVLVVGYDLNFKNSDAFKRSGADPAQVSGRALKIRNSWGTKWGINGHFWMPMEFATNPSTGGDAWTGRL